MSLHAVEVVPVKLEPHPNADTLSIVRVYGWQVVVKTAEWADRGMGAYVPPDYVCPDTPEYEFLGSSRRVKVRKFRNVVSQGLLLPAPPGSKIGDNVIDILGIKRYEPPEPISTSGEDERPPSGTFPKYDVETWQRWAHLFVPGEPVIITEKLHGTSARYFWQDRMRCGSRTSWKRESEVSAWWKALRACPWIETFCKANPTLALYGEVFGGVQAFRYGHQKGQASFRAFDILNVEKQEWIGAEELEGRFAEVFNPDCWVPVLYRGPYSAEKVLELSRGPSVMPGADHIREGCIVRPRTERWNEEIGRVQLKCVSDDYLAKGE